MSISAFWWEEKLGSGPSRREDSPAGEVGEEQTRPT